MHKPIGIIEAVPTRPNSHMRMQIAPRIMARENRIKVDGAPIRGSIRPGQPVDIAFTVVPVLLRVAAHGIGLPDVDARALKRLASGHVDDLEG